MRASLLRSFDKIWIINLHGSANKKETTPDGGKDENIFDIMQGVALFIGLKKSISTQWAKVYYTDVWGSRDIKLNKLADGNLEFKELKVDSKMAYFVPFGNDIDKENYEKGISVAELFPTNVTGIVSGRDDVAIASTREILNERIDIVKNAINDSPIDRLWGKYSRGQSAEKIRNDIMSDGKVAAISFRPFDDRWTYYSGNSCGWILWPREKETMGHLLKIPTTPIGANIGLVFCKTSRTFFSPFVSKNIIAHRLFSAMCEITYIAPLYLYLESEMFGTKWTANLNDRAFQELTKHLTKKPEPIDVFNYVYGILHDPFYGEKYNDYLCRDFPRVPIINVPDEERTEAEYYVSEELFEKYVKAGERLRKLHLMDVKAPTSLTFEPTKPENLEIGAIKYKNGILQLNADTKVYGISEDVWSYQIGGYQVLDKWFKEHKGITLTLEMYSHIENMVGCLCETIKIEDELRKLH